MPRRVFEDVIELARAHGLVLFSDEVYRELEHDPADLEPFTRADVLTASEASALLGIPRSTLYDLARRQELPARQIVRRVTQSPHRKDELQLLVMEFVSAVYGGYFGAAIGILLLASMALAREQDMQSANAQRNFLVCFINGVAALLFIVAGAVD